MSAADVAECAHGGVPLDEFLSDEPRAEPLVGLERIREGIFRWGKHDDACGLDRDVPYCACDCWIDGARAALDAAESMASAIRPIVRDEIGKPNSEVERRIDALLEAVKLATFGREGEVWVERLRNAGASLCNALADENASLAKALLGWDDAAHDADPTLRDEVLAPRGADAVLQRVVAATYPLTLEPKPDLDDHPAVLAVCELKAVLAKARADHMAIAQALGRVHEADGHNPEPAAVGDVLLAIRNLQGAPVELARRIAQFQPRHAFACPAAVLRGPCDCGLESALAELEAIR